MNKELHISDVRDFAPKYSGGKFHTLFCDPPYELGFMNNKWDASGVAFNPETWKGFKELMHDGAFGLAFCGSRGWHRQAVAIEDAGFVIHPTIFLWAFGCLSDDSEILTPDGWKYHDEIQAGDLVMNYDVASDSCAFAPALDVVRYDYDETAYQIQSEATNQIVSRNHRCLIEHDGELVFELAENLNSVEIVPYLEKVWYYGCDVSRTETQPEHSLPSLQNADLSPTESHQSANRFDLLNRLPKQNHHDERKSLSVEISVPNGREKSVLERWLDIQKAKGELRFRQVCSMSDRISRNGAERRLCNGTSVDSRSNTQTLSNADGMRSSQESQSFGQPTRKSRIVSEQLGTQKTRSDGQTRTTLANVKPIHYRGVVWCVKVPTGAFVARRDGKIFVTGNSGFPKATRIDTQIDAAAGVIREYLGKHPNGRKTNGNLEMLKKDGSGLTAPATDDAKAWAGHRYGLQALKPAVEPIILFQKPYASGKVFEQIVRTGAGALNIGETRIGSETVTTKAKTKGESFSSVGDGRGFNGCDESERQGRWAANFILSHLADCSSEICAAGCPVERLGEQSGESKSGSTVRKREFRQSQSTFMASMGTSQAPDSYGDEGTAARFFFQTDFIEEKLEMSDPVFYCAKPSQDERDAGIPKKYYKPLLTMNDGIGGQPIKTTSKVLNYHPTVKPLKLNKYLATLLLPPDKYAPNRRIFCPFAGSGSEMIGAMQAGWDEIVGVEQSSEYAAIANARFDYWHRIHRTRQYLLFDL